MDVREKFTNKSDQYNGQKYKNFENFGGLRSRKRVTVLEDTERKNYNSNFQTTNDAHKWSGLWSI